MQDDGEPRTNGGVDPPGATTGARELSVLLARAALVRRLSGDGIARARASSRASSVEAERLAAAIAVLTQRYRRLSLLTGELIFRAQPRAQAPAGAALRTAGDVEIDFERQEVRVDERRVRLTPSEFKILALLTEEPGTVRTRTEIMHRLWGPSHAGNGRAAENHVSALRRKLDGPAAAAEHIVTVYGVGYSFEPQPVPRGNGHSPPAASAS